MPPKRKFTVPTDDSEDESGGMISGKTVFKKYKDLHRKDKDDITSHESSASTSRNIHQNVNTSSTNDALPPKENQHTSTNVASTSPEVSTPEIPQSTKQIPVPESTNGGLIIPVIHSTPVAAGIDNKQQRKVGKSFGETFAYLKDTNLYKLPPLPQPVSKPKRENSNSIMVNPRQRGNPILKHVRNVPWEYGEVVPDYEIGQKICVLFLRPSIPSPIAWLRRHVLKSGGAIFNMRYHTLNPDYIHERLKKLGNLYEVRVLLVQVDVVNSKPSLKELSRIAMLSDCTMILAWSPEEAGRYLETYKQYENKPPDVLQQRVETDHLSKMQDFLTTIKSINKTDVITLISTFGSLKNIMNASQQEIGDCPGIGSLKASRLHKAFVEPFKRVRPSTYIPQNDVGQKSTSNESDDKKPKDDAGQKSIQESSDSNAKIDKKLDNEDISNICKLKLPSEALAEHKLNLTASTVDK